MLKKILNTLFTKFFTALVGFAVIIFISHILGTSGKGQQAVIVFNINIILLFLTLLGNSTLIYLTPRKTFSQMFIPSFIWISVTSLVFLIVIRLIPALNNDFAMQTVGISFLASITEINYYVLMGKQQVIKANNLRLIYPLTNAVVIFLMWVCGVFTDISQYVFSLWIAYILSLIYGVWILKDEYKSLYKLSNQEFKDVTKTLFRLGAVKQFGSIAQAMNYRVSLWVMAFLFGAEGQAMNGIYSNSTSICEALLLFGTSLALVQYSSLSNEKDNSQAKKLTLQMTKVNVLVTAAGLLVLCLLPESFWVLLFGQGFEKVGYYIRILAVGILFLSTSSNITQYFASRGNFSITASASLAGLAVTSVLCITLIPKYGIMGAAVSAVCSYITGFLIEFIYFLKWIKKD